MSGRSAIRIGGAESRTRLAAGLPTRGALAALLLPVLIAATVPVSADHGPEHDTAGDTRQSKTTGFNPIEALKALGLGLTGGGGGNPFLEPDVAFVLSTRLAPDGAPVARWEIADGYYLYRERFAFALKDTPDAMLGLVELPRGKVKEDAYFGRMEVFYGGVEARVPVTYSGDGPRGSSSSL